MVIGLTGGALVQRLQQVRVAGGAPYVSEALQGSKGVFSLLQEHLLFLPGLTCSVSIPGTECSCTREEKLVSALQEFMATYENHCQGADHLPGVQTFQELQGLYQVFKGLFSNRKSGPWTLIPILPGRTQ